MASEECLRARVGHTFKRGVEEYCLANGYTLSQMVLLGVDRVMNGDSIEESIGVIEEILGLQPLRRGKERTSERIVRVFRSLDEVRARVYMLSGGDPRKEIPPLLTILQRMEKKG